MELLLKLIDIVLHVDDYLKDLVPQYGVWIYAILFLIIFAETGLVVTPFLPGDSLLFAIGALCGAQVLNLPTILILLTIAAILGDTVNYWVGHYMGPKVFKGNIKFLKKEYLDRTHNFYERYGGKTIIIARFVPIVRTFAPFVAGVGSMTYGKFMSYNIFGGIFWVFSMTLAGYFFGGFKFVQDNFSTVILMIIFISILPGIIEYWRERKRLKAAAANAAK
ncbi:MAG TPA: DedA family protein [Verrucomicrobiae bacterium]